MTKKILRRNQNKYKNSYDLQVFTFYGVLIVVEYLRDNGRKFLANLITLAYKPWPNNFNGL